MNDGMKCVGLAIIVEKKECIVDGKKQTYYERQEPCVGFYYDFGNTGRNFIVLTGKLAGETIGSNSIYSCVNFKTLDDLCVENNRVYNYDKFMSEYREYIGEYYTLDSNNTFSRITDQELLEKIRGKAKEYDDTILNNNTDISQMYSAIKKKSFHKMNKLCKY